MQDRYSEQARKAKARIEDVFGLPRGNRTPDDNGGPPRDSNAQPGSLSADEAEAAPVRKGTGSSLSDLREAARASNDRFAKAEQEQKRDAPANSSLGDLPDTE
jgi:hypothetical protein